MAEGELPSGIPTETQGSCSPFEIPAAQEGESMHQTLVIDNEPAGRRHEAGEAAALQSRAKVWKKAQVLVR